MWLYKHYNSEHTLLYIGMTSNLASRTRGHESGSIWFKNVTYIEFKKFDCIHKLKKEEKRQIKKYKPVNNRKDNSEKVKLNKYRWMPLDVEEYKYYIVTYRNQETNEIEYQESFDELSLAAKAADDLREKYYGDGRKLNRLLGFYKDGDKRSY